MKNRIKKKLLSQIRWCGLQMNKPWKWKIDEMYAKAYRRLTSSGTPVWEVEDMFQAGCER